MTGLEKIIQQILGDAQAQADEIIAQAKTSADEIIAQANQQSKQAVADLEKKSVKDVENHKNSAISANDMYRRTEVLKCKQEVISQIIQTAYETVCDMEADKYFAMLEKMIAKNVAPQEGVLCLSENDLDRMPAEFTSRVETIAKNAGGTLTVSQTGAQIENGFVLVYGGVENNCTLKAVFAANHDKMQDVVNNLLYRKEA